MLLPKTEEDVEEGAAGRFMGLHEHDVHFRRAALARSFLRAVGGHLALHLGWTVGARVRHWNPAWRRTKWRKGGKRLFRGHSICLQKWDVHASLGKVDVDLRGVEAVEQDHAGGQKGAQEQPFTHRSPLPPLSGSHGPGRELHLIQYKKTSL